MDTVTLLHLFSFVPIVGFGSVLWFERRRRPGGQGRTVALFRSLAVMAVIGVMQTLTWVFREAVPFAWPQVFVLSGLLYFLALILLEYAIHAKRIAESFLSADFRRSLLGLTPWIVAAAVLSLGVIAAAPSWQWDHTHYPLKFLLNPEAQKNPIAGYTYHMTLITVAYSVVLVSMALLAALRLFNLQQGVIRQRGYPFYVQIVVTVLLLADLALARPQTSIETAFHLPVYWFLLLNVVYIVRLVEEFFFWSQYNLRSDRARMEQRQHLQNLLIRRVIGSAEAEDRAVVLEVMEAALDKMKLRMVVEEYRVTGLAVYRVAGTVARVEDASHIVGYCTPLTDHKSIKNLDKAKLNDQILRTTYDIPELRDTLAESLKDFGKRLIQAAMTRREPIVTSELPEGLKGLQRLVAVVPIFDVNHLVGFLTVFKDSFDKLYPAEREALDELAENLATVYALMAGKEVQKERNRLQGEMQSAREIQTSILPRPLLIPGFEVATFMETATEVGGDVYDYVPTPFGTYFGIGDVAGHGLPAGMMAVISVAALHGALDASRVLSKPLALDQVYDTVNRVLCTLNRDRIGSDKFMTQNYFLANGNRIEHVGTHLVAAVWRAATQTIEDLPGLADRTGFLGLSEYVVSVQSVGWFTMDAGDVLVLYSDGVSEAKNGNATMFGLDGIKQALVTHADAGPDALVAAVLDSLRHHSAAGDLKKHGGRFADDVSLVVLKKL